MKARSFLLRIGILVAILILVTFGLWEISNSKSPLKIKSEKIHLPESAKFVSREAPLTIHISLDVNKFPKYIEALAAERKRKEALKGAIGFRDGLFALAGLNYEKDLFDWASPNLSLSISNSKKIDSNKTWLLAIESKQDHSPNNYLESFWKSKKEDGMNVRKNMYNDNEIFTGFKNYSGKEEAQLSTCLVDNSILLLSPSKSAIEEALKLSNDDDHNQSSDIKLQSIIEGLDDGIGLISVSPQALYEWFGLPKELSKIDGFKGFIASLNAKDSNILLDGFFKIKNNPNNPNNPNNQSHDGEELLRNTNRFAEDYGLIKNPSSILDENNKEFTNLLIRPFLKKALALSISSADTLIASLEEGEMAWLHNKKEWILGTRKGSQLPLLEENLKNKKFVKSILPQEGSPLQVWSRLERAEEKDVNYIKTDLAIILSQEDNKNLWSNSLDFIDKREKNNFFIPIYESSKHLLRKDDNRLPNELYLGSETAKEELKSWSPWLLINSISSKSLQSNIKRLSLALGPENYNDSGIYLRAILEFT